MVFLMTPRLISQHGLRRLTETKTETSEFYLIKTRKILTKLSSSVFPRAFSLPVSLKFTKFKSQPIKPITSFFHCHKRELS